MDLENMPTLTFHRQPRLEFWGYDRQSMKNFAHQQDVVATHIARHLTSSIEEIHLWTPDSSMRHLWSKFRVTHSADDTEAGGATSVTREKDAIFADLPYV